MSGEYADGRPVVVTAGLTKVFKDFWMRPKVRAVDSLDLEIHQHEVFGLLGPNGSGKSTTIKMLLGLLHHTSGHVAVFGKPPSDVSTKKRIGVLPEESYLYPFLNARETLDYYAKLFEIDSRIRSKRIDELLDMVGLTAVQHRQVGEYSKGMQRRIGLAQALINDPEFLILDEPTTGLDPIGTRQVKDLIIELGRRGKTILLSSHQLSDVEDVVDRLAILYGGKKRAEGSVDDLLISKDRLVLEIDAVDDDVVSEIDRMLTGHGSKAIHRVSKPRQRLEELFVGIVEQAQADRIESHGAQAGGATAAFLVGAGQSEAPQATGEALIDTLVQGEAETPEPTHAAPPTATADTASTKQGSIIEDLVSEAPAPAPAPAAPVNQPDVSVQPDADVDESLIDSLLDDEDKHGGKQG